MRAALCALVAALILLPGCGASYKSLASFAAAGARFEVVADPLLLEMYSNEQRVCVNQPPPEGAATCVHDVRKKWEPLRAELAKMRQAWCGFEPAKCPAKAVTP